MSPEKEFDFIITKRNRLEIVGEVKWKRAKARDLAKFKKNTGDLPGRKIIIFKHGEMKGSMNAEDIVKNVF